MRVCVCVFVFPSHVGQFARRFFHSTCFLRIILFTLPVGLSQHSDDSSISRAISGTVFWTTYPRSFDRAGQRRIVCPTSSTAPPSQNMSGQVRLEVPVSGQHLRHVVGQSAVLPFVPLLDVWDAGPCPAPSGALLPSSLPLSQGLLPNLGLLRSGPLLVV